VVIERFIIDQGFSSLIPANNIINLQLNNMEKEVLSHNLGHTLQGRILIILMYGI